MTIYRLQKTITFPSVESASSGGLLAFGGDLSIERLLAAYSRGIFPWYSEGEPILWWSPDPRLVLELTRVKFSKSLIRVIRSGRFTVTVDKSFHDVIDNCATAPRSMEDGTWIVEEMQEAYNRLHEAGFAHSIEVWRENELAGGLYGVSLGAAFFGESMFALQSNASKVALFYLVELLRSWDFHFIDCQVRTQHLIRMGASEIPRREFIRRLEEALRHETRQGKWRVIFSA